jgi:alkaline phosphatase D
MGRPSKVKPVPAGTSRRSFFKASGGAVAALASAPMLALAVKERNNVSPLFQHGVASGDPLTDRVILWTRVTPAAPVSSLSVSWVVATDTALTNVVARGTTKTLPSRDYTVKVDPTGLRPGTTYYYRFAVGEELSPIGRTKTLPTVATRLRMAVVSCSNHAYGYFNAYGRIAERADLDLVMHLGDYIYEYGAGQYGSARTPEPATEILSLSDYRTRHAQYKRDADSQAMHRQHPMVAIWDDHETANNSWRDGAENHQPATEGDWNTRVNNALQAYYEWMPVRVVDPTQPRENYRAYNYGGLADLLMFEERLGARSEQLPTNIGSASGYFVQSGAYLDPTRQMLGSTEEAWLFDRLRTTGAQWKLFGQGVMFTQVKVQGAPNSAGGGVFFNSDAWDGYQPARNRIFEVIKGTGGQTPIRNVVVLTGDIHSSWASDLTQDPNNPAAYDAATGNGSVAVEFIGTSVSSPAIDDPATAIGTANLLLAQNPQIKYIEFTKRGYMLIDVTTERAQAEWWHMATALDPSNHTETFAKAFQTLSGSNRITPVASPSTPVDNPAPLAP